MSTLEMRVGDALALFDEGSSRNVKVIAQGPGTPVLATPLIAAAFAGGAAYGGALVAAFEAGRAVRGG